MDFSAVRHKPVIGYLLALPFRSFQDRAGPHHTGTATRKEVDCRLGMHGWWLGSYEHEKQLRLQAQSALATSSTMLAPMSGSIVSWGASSPAHRVKFTVSNQSRVTCVFFVSISISTT